MGSRVPPPTAPTSLNDKFCNMQLCDKSVVGIKQLLIDLQKLSEDQESADVVFLLDKEEERVYAHKIILMARYYYVFSNFFIFFFANGIISFIIVCMLKSNLKDPTHLNLKINCILYVKML